MANAKRYTVVVDGKSIYVGPVRSAELVYNSLVSVIPLVPELAQHQILLAFGQVPDLPDPDQTYIV